MKKFIQKLVKKPLALVLALLIVISSVSVAVYALNYYDTAEMEVYIRLTDEEGNSVTYEEGTALKDMTGSLNVKPGEKITANISLKTTKTQDGIYNDGTNFNVTVFQYVEQFNSDILKLDTTAMGASKGETLWTCGSNEFRDAKNNMDDVKAIGYSGATADLKDENGDGWVEYNGRSFIWGITSLYSDDELNPEVEGNLGKNVQTYIFTVRDDIDPSVLKMNENGSYTIENPFTFLEDSWATLYVATKDYDGEDIVDSKAYPAYVKSLNTENEQVGTEYVYFKVKQYAESLSLNAGTVNFDTNSTAYGGLAGGTIDTVADTSITEQMKDSVGTGVYTGAGLEGTEISAPAVTPEDEKISFAGWATTPNLTGTENVLSSEEIAAIKYSSTEPTTLYAVYSNTEVYKLVVKLDETDKGTVYKLSYGDSLTTYLASPSKTGSEFAGWDVTGAKDLTAVNSDFVALADSNNTLTVTATWNKVEYSVEYNFDNGDAKESISAYYEDTLSENTPADPEKTGYNFIEWKYYTDAGYQNEYTESTMPAKNLYAKAQWEAKTYSFTVNSNNEDAVTGQTATTETKSVTFGNTLELNKPTKAGYTFAGWDFNNDGVSDASSSVQITKDFAETFLKDNDNPIADALWTQNTYTITFTYGEAPAESGLTANAPISSYNYTYGQKLSDVRGSAPALPSYSDTASGQTISATGWSQVINADEVLPITEANNRTLTIASQWTPVYKITFNLDNGEEAVVKHLKEGEKIDIPAPTKTGYELAGWYVTGGSSDTLATVPATMGTTELNYTAKWNIRSYNLVYVIDGVEETPIKVKYNNPVTVKDIPTKVGSTYATVWTVAEGLNIGTIGAAGNFNMPANDVKLSISSTVNTHKFTISYGEYEGKQDIVQDVTYGTPISNTVTDADTWTGHRFSGWEIKVGSTVVDELPATMPDTDVTVTALYGTLYTLTYDYDNGGATATESYNLLEGEALTSPTVANPTKTGYDFAGWKYFQGAIQLDTAPATMPATDVKAVAQWTAHKNTVTFGDADTKWDDGTTSVITKDVDYGEDVTAPTQKPVKDGYDFLGWDIDGDGDYDVDDERATMPDNAITPKPVFDAKTVKVSPKDGETTLEPMEIKFDKPIGNLDHKDIEGKDFDGWYVVDEQGNYVTDNNGKKIKIDLSSPLEGQIPYTENLNIATRFTVTDSYYIANGINNDGTFSYSDKPLTFTGETNETYTVPGEKDAVAEDYKDIIEFKGWAEDKNSNEPAILELSASFGESGKTYYAIYDLKEYTVKFLNEDGSVVKEDAVKYGGAIEQPGKDIEPVKEGYTFSGWLDAEGKKPDDYGTMPAKDLTFTAQYISNDVSAVFMKKNTISDEYVTFETIKETVGETIKTPEGTNSYNPYKFGYKFTGWADENGKTPEEYGTMPNGSVTFYAQYELDSTFIALTIGGVVVSGAVAGTALAANAALITTGAVVGGVAVVAGAAALAKHTHKVTYYVDGEVYKTYYCVEGTKVLTPADPSKDGYTFAGWDNEIPEKMPANDLEFNATWSSSVDDEIPDTGSATAGLAAFAVISSAAAAAYVLTKKKKDEE